MWELFQVPQRFNYIRLIDHVFNTHINANNNVFQIPITKLKNWSKNIYI